MTKMSMKIALLLDVGLAPEKIAKLCGCALNTVYHHKRDYDAVKHEVEEMLKGI